MKVIIICLLAVAKAAVSLNYPEDPSGWDSYFMTESHEHSDAVDVVDPSGWNYDRGAKSSQRNNKEDKEQILKFCEHVQKNKESDTTVLIEKEMQAAVKSKIEAFFSKEPSINETLVFVKRFIRILLETAELQDKYQEEGSDVSGIVEIKMSSEELKTLIHFSNSIANISMRELDSILSASFHRKYIPTFGLPELMDKIFFTASQKEVWLPLVFGLLMFFIVRLLVTRKTTTGIVTSLILVIFIASYLVEYYRMYKEAEIHQRVLLQKHSEVPSSCYPTHSWWSTLLESLVSSVSFEQEDECVKYHKAVLLDPLVEVSPSRVLSSILTDFVFYPVSKLGVAIAAFATAVLGGLPFHYGWIVWLCSSTAIFMLTILALVMIFGGSVQLRGVFSGLSISSNQTPQITNPAAPAVPASAVLAPPLPAPTSAAQPLLEAVSGMSNFVLMDANSLGTLVLRAQSSVAVHSGVQELAEPPKDAAPSQLSKEKLDLSELSKKRSLAVIGKDPTLNTDCEPSNVEKKMISKDINSDIEKDSEQKSSDIASDKEELLCTYEVIQSDTLCPLETSVKETGSVSVEREEIPLQNVETKTVAN